MPVVLALQQKDVFKIILVPVVLALQQKDVFKIILLPVALASQQKDVFKIILPVALALQQKDVPVALFFDRRMYFKSFCCLLSWLCNGRMCLLHWFVTKGCISNQSAACCTGFATEECAYCAGL